MSTIREEYLNLLSAVKRDGVEELIEWLRITDFFTSPASTKYHGNYPGGLLDHSLNVFDALTLINKEFKEKDSRYSDDTITLVALLHDLCKVNTYVLDEEPATDAQMKYANDLLDKAGMSDIPKEQRTKGYVSKVIEHLKNNGLEELFPKFAHSYKVKDGLPMGHGEKSVYMIQKFIALKDEEAIAIRWHLGSFDPGVHFFYPSGVANTQAVVNYPLVSMLVAADYLATWQVDEIR
jgi:hypothetical protein